MLTCYSYNSLQGFHFKWSSAILENLTLAVRMYFVHDLCKMRPIKLIMTNVLGRKRPVAWPPQVHPTSIL
jgi:hypothetical protein